MVLLCQAIGRSRRQGNTLFSCIHYPKINAWTNKLLQCNIKHFDELELIMEQEHTHLEDLKDSLLAEQMNVLQSVFNLGYLKWRDHTYVKPQLTELFKLAEQRLYSSPNYWSPLFSFLSHSTQADAELPSETHDTSRTKTQRVLVQEP